VLKKEANKLIKHQIAKHQDGMRSHDARMNFWASPAPAAAFPSLATVPLRLLSMHTRLVPRAFRVCAQVVCAFCLYSSAVRAFLAGGVAPKAQNCANYCAGPKESTQGNPNRAQGFIATFTDSFSLIATCTKSDRCGTMMMLLHGDHNVAWRCDLWYFRANGVGNPGVQLGMPPLGKSVTCQRR
jgi:hypothetical protein